VGNETERISFDLRPSDAINIAVRCKVLPFILKIAWIFHLNRPDGKPCAETTEFDLVRNMLIASVEERYRDAAQLRDKLTKLRSKRRNWST
ncbi:Bifunctional nuclease, partial [Thalictrum thalictroides]